jgi:hypothetical protein
MRLGLDALDALLEAPLVELGHEVLDQQRDVAPCARAAAGSSMGTTLRR